MSSRINNVVRFTLFKCNECIHHIPFKSNISNSKYNHDKCERFRSKNMIDGEYIYQFCDDARKDENLCGESGKFFIKK